MDVLFQSLALFIPILAANQGPAIARWLNLPLSRMPVSRRFLGENKTVAAYYVGPLCAAFVLILYTDPDWWKEGPALGLGAVLGDHIKSGFKRLLGMPPGAPWFVDRIDFAIGGGLAAYRYFPWVTVEHVLWLIAIAYPVHLIGNRISYGLGWRKTPH